MQACPLCGAAGRPYMRLSHTGVFRCANRKCDLQFAAPQLDDHDLDQAYASLYYRADGSRPLLENTADADIRYLLDRLAERLGSPGGKRVLDYGCGVGTLLRVAGERGALVTGIEQSPTARESMERAGFATVYSDVEALRQAEPGARFDWIILCEVIEHLRRPWEDLARLRPLLKPAGDLIVVTPNFDAMRSRLSGPRWDQRTNPTHLFYFTPRSLTAVLNQAGFRPQQLPPVSWYSEHGPLRRQLQRLLCATGLQGSMMFCGKVAGAAASTAV